MARIKIAGTPVPKTEVERRSAGSGKVDTRPMTAEDWEKYGPLNTKVERKGNIVTQLLSPAEQSRRSKKRNELKEENDMSKKFPHLTKEFFEAEFAKGKTGDQIQREQKLPPGTFNYYLKRAGAVNPNSKARNRKDEIVPNKPEVKKSEELVPQKETDSFIAATIERDQRVLVKSEPKKSGRVIHVNSLGQSEVIESELEALGGYIAAMPVKHYKLEISLIEVHEIKNQ